MNVWATILGAVASICVIVPVAVRLLITPVVRAQIDESNKQIMRRIAIYDRRLTKHIERGRHHE